MIILFTGKIIGRTLYMMSITNTCTDLVYTATGYLDSIASSGVYCNFWGWNYYFHSWTV